MNLSIISLFNNSSQTFNLLKKFKHVKINILAEIHEFEDWDIAKCNSAQSL